MDDKLEGEDYRSYKPLITAAATTFIWSYSLPGAKSEREYGNEGNKFCIVDKYLIKA
jgi:hypothetical protein